MPSLKKMLNPEDMSAIDATGATNWVPDDPAEVILPYAKQVAQEFDQDKDQREERLERAKQIVDSYGNIIRQCRELEAEIESRCKAVKVPLNKDTNLRVIEAMGRVFGIETAEITFEQYKACLKALADINNAAVPDPENL